MIRMSALPFSEFCGHVAGVMEAHGAGRPAVMGSAFHARCAESPDAPLWLMKLTPDERKDIAEWHYPGDRRSIEGRVLKYTDGNRETEVGLTSDGRFCESGHPSLMTLGHSDWDMYVPEEGIVYVTDIKRSRYTVSEGPRSIQLQAYGFALAQKYGAKGYKPAIWAATEGELWEGEVVWSDSFEAADSWARIEHASNNRGESVTGGHCTTCYVREHCKEHMLPAALAALSTASPELRAKVARAIESMAEGGPVRTSADALAVLVLAKGLEDLGKKLTESARAYASTTGLADPVTGKSYRRLMVRGRESGPSVAELRKTMGANADRLIKRGADYPRWTWAGGGE